jgi:serine/threonine protein phosphatase PrpC
MADIMHEKLLVMITAIEKWLSTAAELRSLQLVPGFRISLATDVGLVRKDNQDRVAALSVSAVNGSQPFVCVAVSDGMGGLQDGGDCATATLAALFSSLIVQTDPSLARRLELATRQANLYVFDRWKSKGGATLSAAIVTADGLIHVSNVGDSRIYGLRNSSVERLTVDDSLADAFGGEGRELLQFIGVGPPLLPKVSRIDGAYDSLLLTSDGAHYFQPAVFDELYTRAGDTFRAAERILAVARYLGGPDNISVAAIRLTDVVGALRASQPHLPTIWSGVRELQLLNALHETSGQESSIGQEGNSNSNTDGPDGDSDPRQDRKSKRRKQRQEKRKDSEKNQLEIRMTTDESDDADR